MLLLGSSKRNFKTIISFLLLIAVFLVPLQNNLAFSAVKAGAKCTKISSKSVVGNKTYTCIKSGKKLVWNKGVVVVKPTPTPTPTLNLELGWKGLYKKTLRGFNQGLISNLVIKVFYSPNVNKSNANLLKQSYEEVLTLYSSRFGPDKRIFLFFMGEGEKDWYDQKVREFEGSSVNHNWWGGNHCSFDAFSECGMGTNSVKESIFYFQVGSKWTPDARSAVNANHEVAHMYQKSYIGDGAYRFFPCWFNEGQANFLGFVTLSRIKDLTDGRRSQIMSLDRGFSSYRSFTQQDWFEAMNKVEADFNFCTSNGLGYSLGMLLNEYIYTNYTLEQIEAVFISLTEGLSWDSAIEKNLGLSKLQLKTEGSKYVYSQVQELG
jgi:hypothetical protein